MSQEEKNGSQRRVQLNYFYRILVLLILVLCVPTLSLYFLEVRHDTELLNREQMALIQQRQQLISEYFSQIRADLFFLSRQNELLEGHAAAEQVAELGDEYLAFIQAHQNYDQVRFLNLKGQELVRVNLNQGQPVLVPPADLQNKSHRYYFRDSVRLDYQAIYTSVFDLNMENKRLEVPHKPMIRFATPVFSNAQDKLGVVIINYLGDYLLNAIRQGTELLPGQMMLLNPQGYWLLHPQQEKSWGFLVTGNGKQRFPKEFPAAWDIIHNQQQGQFADATGLFTFSTIPSFSTVTAKPFQMPSSDMGGAMRYWKLVSHVPASHLNDKSRRLQLMAVSVVGSIFIFALLPAWNISRLLARRSFYRQEVKRLAYQDKLTGLTSRALFDDRLQQSIERAHRNSSSLALLYMDLDGFKAINDRFGHAAGDEVLQNVALRLGKQIRSADTLARLGGDEFAIILDDLEQRSEVVKLPEKILNAFIAPFEVKGQEMSLGVSIGISLYPDHGTDPEELLQAADLAMYQVKKQGKNSFTFAITSEE